jgi:hypothetical protein
MLSSAHILWQNKTKLWMLHHNFSISEGCRNHILGERILHISYFNHADFRVPCSSIDRQESIKKRNLITEIRTAVVNTCNRRSTERSLRCSQQERDKGGTQHVQMNWGRRHTVLAWKRVKVLLGDNLTKNRNITKLHLSWQDTNWLNMLSMGCLIYWPHWNICLRSSRIFRGHVSCRGVRKLSTLR